MLFAVNRVGLFTRNHVPEVAEVTAVHVSEGLKSSKSDPTLCMKHRAGGPDYKRCPCLFVML